MAIINVDDAYILNETGAQVDKVTGLYFKDESTSAAEKAFAQLNIGTAGSNRNLLDNPWWGSDEVVNQRAASTWTGNDHTYLIDRWDFTANNGANMTVTVGASGLNIVTAGSVGYVIEKLDAWQRSAINGKTITLSVMFADGTVKSGTGVFNLGTILYAYSDNDINLRLYSPSTSRAEFTIDVKANKNLLIRAVKLELGSVSTLANDVPPDYGTELIKCRGYFERIHSLGSSEIVGMGMGVSASSVRIGIPSLICHTIQSVTYSGGGLLLEGGGNYRTLTSIGRLNATPKNGFLTVTCGSSDAITLYQTYALVGTAAGGYIDISADL